MPTGFFALQRFWLRVDGVEIRLRDTRLYHKFGTKVLLREYTSRRATFAQLRELGLPADAANLHDPAPIADQIPLDEHCMEEIILP